MNMFDNLRFKMLNREAASNQNKPQEIIRNMNLNDGDVVGDIGTGGGYFALEFSKVVGDTGTVYAIDTNPKSLDHINIEAKKMGFNNIETVLGKEDNLVLPKKVDIFFMRNVFHHLPEPVGYFKNIRQLLKDDGKIALVEYNKKGFNFVGIFGHYTPYEELLKVMDEAGFSLLKNYDFLEEQSYSIFKLKDPNKN
jgi:arsenite methyltransferase